MQTRRCDTSSAVGTGHQHIKQFAVMQPACTLNLLATRYTSEFAGLLVAGLKACTSWKQAPKKYMIHRVECSNIVKICNRQACQKEQLLQLQ